MANRSENQGNLFEQFPGMSEIFAYQLKVLIKPLKCFEQLLRSCLSAISFCSFKGNTSVYIFLEKSTFVLKILGFTVGKGLVMNGSWLIAGCFRFIFHS